MTNKLTSWFRGLSTVGKVAVSTAAIASTGVVLAASVPSSTPTPTPNAEPIKQEAITEKKDCGPETINKTKKISYKSTTLETSTLYKGETKLKNKGANGERTLTYKITYDKNCKKVGSKLSNSEVTTEPITKVTLIGTKEKYTAPPAPKCDTNYTGGCVPIVSYDLDCPDIGFSVVVVGSDRHRFDGDGDGYGCESY